MKFDIADHTGHTTLDFAKNEAGLADAQRKFDELVSSGHAAFAKIDGAQGRKVKAMDPTADTHLFMPPLQGG
jgi:hypothetical protein